MAINFGKILKGVASKALGPLGAVGADWAIGQAFGKGAKPSNALKNATAAKANPYQDTMVADANAMRQSGQNISALVTPQLMDAIKARAGSLSSSEGVDAVGNQIRQQGYQNANRAYQGSSANMAQNLARRGIGGGLAASAMLKLNSNNAANRAGIEQNAANAMIAKRESNQDRLLSLMSGLQNQAQSDTMRGSQMLGSLGQQDANLQNANADRNAATIQNLLSLYGQSQGQRRTPKKANPWGDEAKLYDTFGGMLG